MRKLFFSLALFVLTMPLAALAQEADKGFVSLTKIENVKFAGNAAELPAFFNSIYMICIGLAAVIGVLQIMRAGVTWMTAAGSHEKIGDAKNLITQTIVGLVLVLAPTIVFSIINPEILSLKINNLGELALRDKAVAEKILWEDTESSFMESNVRCAQEGGLPVPHCKPTSGGKSYAAESDKVCEGKLFTVCMKREGTDEDKDPPASNPGTGGEIVADFKGGATAPPSVIPNTIGKTWEPNGACKQIQDGEIISRTGSQETCCSYQESPTVACSVQARSYKNLDSVAYCTCKAK